MGGRPVTRPDVLQGYGVGLADDYDDNFATAERKLGKAIDPSPFDDDFMDFYVLASEVVEARKPDNDPTPATGCGSILGCRQPTG